MKHTTRFLPLLLLASLSLGGVAQAQTMDFESFTPNCQGEEEPVELELIENGLQLVPQMQEWCVFDGTEDGPDSELNGNGGNFLGFCGSCDGPGSFTLTRVDGEPFDLLTIDLSSLINQPGGPGGPGGEGPPGDFSSTFQITGFPAQGPPIVEEFTYEFGVWATYPLNGMLAVESVEITLTGDGFDSSFDNIVTALASAPPPPGAPGGATVPIPTGSTLGMLLLAALVLLLGLCAMRSPGRQV